MTVLYIVAENYLYNNSGVEFNVEGLDGASSCKFIQYLKSGTKTTTVKFENGAAVFSQDYYSINAAKGETINMDVIITRSGKLYGIKTNYTVQ